MFTNKQSGQARLPKPEALGNGGQVLLTVVLVMVVALTVGLSLASRSIVEIRTSTEEADSQRALVAAESGIEQALEELTTETSYTGEFSDVGSGYKATVTAAEGDGKFRLNNGNLIEQGEGVDIWFVQHSDGVPDYSSASWSGDNTLDIYWGTSSESCENAALEVVVIVDTGGGSYSLKRQAVDPCGTTRGNNFITTTIANGTYSIPEIEESLHHKYTVGGAGGVEPDSTVLFMRIVPIYTNAIMGIDAGFALPTQGYSIASTGTFDTPGGQVKRSISVFKQFGQLPIEYLNYGLFSP